MKPVADGDLPALATADGLTGDSGLSGGEDLARAVLGALDETLWVVDGNGRLRHVTPARAGLRPGLPGPALGDSVAAWLLAHLHPDETRVRALCESGRLFADDAPRLDAEQAQYEFRLRWGAQSAAWYSLRLSQLPSAADAAVSRRWLLLLREAGGWRQMEHELRLAAAVFENSLEGILITDAHGLIIQVNRAFAAITGYTARDALGRKPSFLRSGTDNEPAFRAIRAKIAAGGLWEGELLNRRCNGDLFPAWVSISGVRGEQGELVAMITTFRDISESKNSEERIRRLAYYDLLTGLPNRTLFTDRLSHALQRAERAGTLVSLLFLDLDGFKEINDSMGHGVGDLLLKQVAERLRRCVRGEDTVARMGGDEFTVVLADQSDRGRAVAGAGQVAEKIRQALREPFALTGREMFVSTSIGIAVYPTDGCEGSTLLRNADTAMYAAKEGGKNGFVFYQEAMSARTVARLDLQSAMHRAVLDQQFELLFQPQVRLQDQVITAAECLLRWAHPTRGRISPSDFVPIAEQSGLIVPLGRWVLDSACRQLAAWRAAGVQLDRMAVNLSARQFADEGLVDAVARALHDSGLEPAALELELTESILMKDVDYALAVLRELKSMGVRIAIDDFGTGYSSLNYLKQLPLDCLKIDRAFVGQLGAAEHDARIAGAIMALARSFDLSVSAEGVETTDQLVALQNLGCDQGQGYLFGAPWRPAEFGERWRRQRRAASG